jgi:methionine-rich copper-binding protein CopC
MLRTGSTAILTLVVAGLISAAADAHPELKAADPPVGGAVTASPKEIRMSFSEGVISKFSGIEIKDQTGKTIVTGAAATDRNDKTQLVVPLREALPPGTYSVDWHAVAADTHRLQGHFSFRVEH